MGEMSFTNSVIVSLGEEGRLWDLRNKDGGEEVIEKSQGAGCDVAKLLSPAVLQ